MPIQKNPKEVPAGDGVEKRRRLEDLNIDELHVLKDSLRNLLNHKKERGMSQEEIAPMEEKLKTIGHAIRELEKDIENGKDYGLRERKAKPEWSDPDHLFGHEPELTRGFGHEEGGIGKPVSRRDDRGDGRVEPKSDLTQGDQKLGFGHPRAHLVDSDFMPQG